MTTISDFRTRVKGALGITGTSTERGFSDTNVDQHIQQAVEELSVAVPLQATTDLTLAPGSRTLMLSSLSRLLQVVAVEYPVDAWPRRFVEFERWGGALTLAVAPPDAAATARVYYDQGHLVDSAGSTVAAVHEYLVVEGATAFALLARAAGAAQSAESATAQPLTYQHLRIAQTRLSAWRTTLARLQRRLRQSSFRGA